MSLSDVISPMRLLDGGSQTAQSIASELTISPIATAQKLHLLRDVFGAAEENKNGEWRLTFRPQWLKQKYLSAASPELSVRVLDETPGTNELAKAAKRGAVFFAEHQTQGRGRQGRSWLAMPAANIAITARLQAPKSPAGFSLAIGAALWRALGGDKNGLRLKWPNDLLNARNEKIGGILIEAAGGDVMIGAGVNLMMTPQLRRHLARPVCALPNPPPRNECGALICKTICTAAAKFAKNGLESFLADARMAHFLQDGEEFCFVCGGEKLRGRFAGFGGDGALLLRQNGGGVRECVSGEIANVAGG